MMKWSLAFALTASFASQALAAPAPVAPCAETDIHCILRLLDQKNEETKSWARENGLLKDQVVTITKANDLLRADNEALSRALKPALDAVKSNQRAWYESPVLWVSGGIVLGVGLTVLSIWGVSRLQETFPRAN